MTYKIYFDLAAVQRGYHLIKTSVFYLQHFRISKLMTKWNAPPHLLFFPWGPWWKREKGCVILEQNTDFPPPVCSTFLDSVKRNRSLSLILSSLKPEKPTAETEIHPANRRCFVLSSPQSLPGWWQLKPSLGYQRWALGEALLKLNSSQLIKSKNSKQQKARGGKTCSPEISGSIPRTFLLPLPAAPINSHSNQPTAFQRVQEQQGKQAAGRSRGEHDPKPQAPI